MVKEKKNTVAYGRSGVINGKMIIDYMFLFIVVIRKYEFLSVA